jgi:hypothetical protein
MSVVEKIDYLSTDHVDTLDVLEKLSNAESLKIQVNAGLDEALRELENLHSQVSSQETQDLLGLCKTAVIESISSQFGLASQFIAAADGGSVTTTHNFEKGITSTERDAEKHKAFVANNDGSRSWDKVRATTGYDDGFTDRRKTDFKTKEVIVDAYTGKPLPKDGRAHIDHIVSAKEIERKAENHLFLSPEERAKMATSDANTSYTFGSANQSKSDQKMEDWLEKKRKTGETNAEKYGIDKEAAMEKDRQARQHIQAEVTLAKTKKYSQELLQTGAKDAANMAAFNAIGVIMRDLTQAIFEEIHLSFQQRGQESLKTIFIRFKTRIERVLKEIIAKWKDILTGSFEAALIAFLSNIVVFVINLFASTLKKLVTMIRAGFVSLCQAIKMLANPPEGMDRDEVNYQALKILTAGLIGAASMGLYAGIEKLLQAIPGLQPLMMFPIPFPGEAPRTVSDIIAAILTGMAGGLLTTVTLYLMDTARNAKKQDQLRIQLVAQSGLVVEYKIAQSWCVLDDAYGVLNNTVQAALSVSIETDHAIRDSHQTTKESIQQLTHSVSQARERLMRLKEVKQ